MKKIFLVLGISIFVFWLVSPAAFNKFTESAKDKVSKEIKKRSNSAVLGISKSIQNKIQTKTEEVLGETTQALTGEKESNPEVEAKIVDNVPQKETKKILLVDYLTGKNIRLNLTLNTDYYLDLRNVPEGSCLYINDQSYPLLHNEFLKVRFDQNGKYDFYFAPCQKTEEAFGQIVVE